MNRLTPGSAGERGRSATPILVFIGIVGLSLVFFFALTLPRQLERKRQRAVAQQTATATAAATAATAAATPRTQTEAEATAPTPEPADPPAPPRPPERFASQRAFMQAVAGRLAAGDVESAVRVLGTEALPEGKEAFFRTLFSEAKLKPATESPLREVGDVGELYRWAIRLGDGPASAPAPRDPASGATTLAALEVEIDVARDAARGWKAIAVHFPEALRAHIAVHLGTARVPTAVATAADEQNDPLKITARFLEAILKQDYSLARSVTDTDKVTREKVAGLCILFEEGGYRLADQRPLSATATGGESAWVIVKVTSERQAAPVSDFGLELQKNPAGAWRVAGVNFSKMLAGYMQAAGVAEGVAYTPIVKNPSGGESLVVYFEFDQAGLVPRAQRQLEIVANLLRDDTARKLRLSGFADAIGGDEYNRRLSAARAHAARNALIALGVSPEQIVTEGLGKLQPLDPNTKPDGSDNPEGRSRNRRTEIFLDF